ncbi:hypothetical protein ANANG_G00082430 [Anguilla anguilla]|uniref:TNFR-Cys domain-containing protein n=1 Tax=Anguilla anguilla TaxID=7936 RepID=A0A9D3S521_ANGAN|nr:hypothetical protein ANANG_G00082430 [Anguilla anguilla]
MTVSRTRLFLFLCAALFGNVGSVADICRGVHCFTAETADSRPCAGTYCPGRPPRQPWQFTPTTQGRSAQIAPNHHNARHPSSPSRAISDPYTIIHPQRGDSDLRRESARRRPSEVSYGCTGADCVTPQRQPSNDSRECRGIECRLPLRIRPKPRPRPCVGERCPAGSEDTGSQPTLVHMADRAAQGLGEFPDFGYPASELGGAPLGVQLTCDIKPGENEVPSEDALILQLQLAKGQEKFVEALKSQQVVIRDLQQRLAEQQDTLIGQQREILEHQRKMYEQMDLIKVQYSMLSETVKQMSFQSLQDDIQSYFETHLQGLQNQVRSHLQKSYAVHKVDVDAKVMDVGHPLLDCGSCGPEEYCDFQRDTPRCERCTMCPSGFFLVSQCSPTSDRICQDRDECLEIPNLCGERVKCLNTPGGFRCLGVSEREASANVCGHDYFYNRELEECQACSDCDGEPVVFPCSAASDTVCGSLTDVRLSQSWAAMVALPPARAPTSHIYPGMQLNIREKEHSTLLSNHDGALVFQVHGLIWADHNFALKHSCRNFLQLSVRMNSSEEDGRDLSGVRVEQPEAKFYQSVSVSTAAEVEPNHTLSLFLKSPNHHCNQSKDVHVYDLPMPFSLLWLSHDTGAVAMAAQTSVSVHYQTTYRPTFKVISVSDPYMVSLSHDSRAVRFTETGVVKFVFQQALYSMGHTCIREGYSLIAYLNRNATNMELMQVFKSGVNYRDTSISLSGAASVDAGEMLSFEIHSPVQCNVRYFGDGTGISTLSLIWIPSTASSALSATISKMGLPAGAVRNKALSFYQVSGSVPQVQLVATGQFARKNFVFRESGAANVAFNLKLIHSCNVVKLTLYRQEGDQAQSTPVAQQVGGHMPEGAEWTSVGLRATFEVHNGTMIFITLDCVRGRINQITHEGGTNISILWVAS